jgi:hypothetical protein
LAEWPLLFRSRPLFSFRRNIIGPPIILIDAHRSLRVISSILDATDGLRFIWLISVGEFFNAFASSICDLREALSIP